MTELTLDFPADHPAAAGHFPGNPVVPGALLLGELLRAMESALDRSLIPCEMDAVKFYHPVHPGERVTVVVSEVAAGGVRFTCNVGTTTVMSGQLRCRPTC